MKRKGNGWQKWTVRKKDWMEATNENLSSNLYALSLRITWLGFVVNKQLNCCLSFKRKPVLQMSVHVCYCCWLECQEKRCIACPFQEVSSSKEGFVMFSGKEIELWW